MEDQTLLAISPIDGRYNKKVSTLKPMVSEFGLMRNRIQAEIAWLITLCQSLPNEVLEDLNAEQTESLRDIYLSFKAADAQQVKEIESTTNHDVKAIEYYIRSKISGQASLKHLSEYVHFACTSEDINNVAYALMCKEVREKILLPGFQGFTEKLRMLAHEYANISMLSRTHGQTASPTTVGKELANVAARYMREIKTLEDLPILAKMNGAVGNYNAHHFTFPEQNWLSISKAYIESLGLTWNAYTTQIEPHDNLAEYFDTLKRLNTISIDFAKDMWSYISIGYYKQKLKDHEVGSSTMPHKVNPIDFENAEGNLLLANALLCFFSQKLPISRWQRDLTDSTTLRNIGVAFAHTLIGLTSLNAGLDKCALNETAIKEDLVNAPEVLAEAIQMLMRRYQIENAYEKLKEVTRGQAITAESLKTFIETLDVPASEKARLLSLKPRTYTGLACMLAENI